MGTRADFYVRQDGQMKWLGSKAWDGYPDGITGNVLQSTSSEQFENEVEAFLKGEDDATFPDEGWPWPWADSRTTDYSYIFENGKVMASCFGYPLFDPLKKEEEEEGEEDEELKMEGYFPDMSHLKNVKLSGNSSGLIVVQVRSEG
jgi:hypothetical protein